MVSTPGRKSARLWVSLHNWRLPSNPTAMDHLQTSCFALICSSLSPAAVVTNIPVLTSPESHKSRPAVHVPRCRLIWSTRLDH